MYTKEEQEILLEAANILVDNFNLTSGGSFLNSNTNSNLEWLAYLRAVQDGEISLLDAVATNDKFAADLLNFAKEEGVSKIKIGGNLHSIRSVLAVPDVFSDNEFSIALKPLIDDFIEESIFGLTADDDYYAGN